MTGAYYNADNDDWLISLNKLCGSTGYFKFPVWDVATTHFFFRGSQGIRKDTEYKRHVF